MAHDDMTLERRKTRALKPHPANSRKHSKAQIAMIWESIKRNRFNNPIVIDETDTILAGHGRHAGAKLGKMDEVPVLVVRGLTEAQKRAYIIADNRIAEESEWDKDKLLAEIAALGELDEDAAADISYLDLGAIDDDIAAALGSVLDDETPEDKRDREEGKKAKAKRTKTGGDPHGDPDAQGGDPSKDKDSINFPLYVVLTPPQHKEWKRLRGELSDKQFVTKMLDNIEAIHGVLN